MVASFTVLMLFGERSGHSSTVAYAESGGSIPVAPVLAGFLWVAALGTIRKLTS
jgi:hypothetical protein